MKNVFGVSILSAAMAISVPAAHAATASAEAFSADRSQGGTFQETWGNREFGPWASLGEVVKSFSPTPASANCSKCVVGLVTSTGSPVAGSGGTAAGSAVATIGGTVGFAYLPLTMLGSALNGDLSGSLSPTLTLTPALKALGGLGYSARLDVGPGFAQVHRSGWQLENVGAPLVMSVGIRYIPLIGQDYLSASVGELQGQGSAAPRARGVVAGLVLHAPRWEAAIATQRLPGGGSVPLYEQPVAPGHLVGDSYAPQVVSVSGAWQVRRAVAITATAADVGGGRSRDIQVALGVRMGF